MRIAAKPWKRRPRRVKPHEHGGLRAPRADPRWIRVAADHAGKTSTPRGPGSQDEAVPMSQFPVAARLEAAGYQRKMQ